MFIYIYVTEYSFCFFYLDFFDQMPNNNSSDNEKKHIEKVSSDLNQILIPRASDIFRHFLIHEIDVLKLLNLALKGLDYSETETDKNIPPTNEESISEPSDIAGASANYSSLNNTPKINTNILLKKKLNMRDGTSDSTNNNDSKATNNIDNDNTANGTSDEHFRKKITAILNKKNLSDKTKTDLITDLLLESKKNHLLQIQRNKLPPANQTFLQGGNLSSQSSKVRTMITNDTFEGSKDDSLVPSLLNNGNRKRENDSSSDERPLKKQKNDIVLSKDLSRLRTEGNIGKQTKEKRKGKNEEEEEEDIEGEEDEEEEDKEEGEEGGDEDEEEEECEDEENDDGSVGEIKERTTFETEDNSPRNRKNNAKLEQHSSSSSDGSDVDTDTSGEVIPPSNTESRSKGIAKFEPKELFNLKVLKIHAKCRRFNNALSQRDMNLLRRNSDELAQFFRLESTSSKDFISHDDKFILFRSTESLRYIPGKSRTLQFHDLSRLLATISLDREKLYHYLLSCSEDNVINGYTSDEKLFLKAIISRSDFPLSYIVCQGIRNICKE